VPTEKEIEAEARKQCLRAFEPYTYGPYFDALRDEFRRKAREILETRERTDVMTINRLCVPKTSSVLIS
jgi:hypothetical protein